MDQMNARNASLLRTEHGHVQEEGAHFVIQIFRHAIVIVIPAVLLPQPADRFGPGEPQMVPLWPAQVQHVLLAEQPLRPQHAEDSLLARKKVVARKEMAGESCGIEARGGSLSAEDGMAGVAWCESICEVCHGAEDRAGQDMTGQDSTV